MGEGYARARLARRALRSVAPPDCALSSFFSHGLIAIPASRWPSAWGRLLAGFRFKMLPVLCEPRAERDNAYALPLAALVAERVPRPFANRLALHWLTAPMILITRRPAAEPV